MKGSLEFYKNTVVNDLKAKLNKKTIIQIPKIKKIVLNMGLGEAKNNKNLITEGLKALDIIAAQKSVATLSKKDIAGFKIRKDLKLGTKVTLRSERMYSFLSRFINVYIPRIRDFHGLKKSFDGNGNLTIGLNDGRIFPELPVDLASNVRGLSVTIVTDAKNNEDAFELLSMMGIPFVK